MRVLIIEDEAQAARRLESLIKEADYAISVEGHTDSVKSSVKWLKENSTPDLIFMDIQLGDGLSFEIFDQVEVKCPVVFTTAYDEYALRAFKVNSVDYILKPIDSTSVRAALVKFKGLTQTIPASSILTNIEHVVQMLSRKYKERFVVRVGEHLRTIEMRDIRYFFSQEKATFCATEDGRHHILDFTLEQLEGMVDPAVFFRINRKYLISSRSIADIVSFSNSRLRIVLKGSDDNDVIVARERVQEFKDWLDR
ncbi:MAG: LytTR family DNA-binding domain-containing protein [Cyclobacteriaceae bacterium]|jgi:DNA-binding LytR/AlgR family response regulator|nr:LytTR family DNA-binding domain-containing protein [Cyclobacteriaceae bacterium]